VQILQRVAVALVLVPLLSVPAPSQQTAAAYHDQQAIGIITQALNAAGGTDVLSGVGDCTSSGTIIYYWTDGPVQGTASVKTRGLHQLRIDATFTNSSRTVVVNNGSGSVTEADGSVTLLPNDAAVALGSMTLPHLALLAAAQDNSVSITYVGLVDHLGQRVHDIRVQKYFAPDADPTGALGKRTVRDFFIDQNSLLIVGVLNLGSLAPDGTSAGPAFEFSNYQTINGVAVPFSISESARGQTLFTIQLDQITLNSNLADTDFALPN